MSTTEIKYQFNVFLFIQCRVVNKIDKMLHVDSNQNESCNLVKLYV